MSVKQSIEKLVNSPLTTRRFSLSILKRPRKKVILKALMVVMTAAVILAVDKMRRQFRYSGSGGASFTNNCSNSSENCVNTKSVR